MKQNEHKQPFLLIDLARWAADAIRKNLTPLTASLIIGFLAHMFAFTNKLVNYDDVECLFSKGMTYQLGRWGLCFLDSIFPNYSMPWIYGVITIALMAIAVCIVIHVFQIHSKLLQVLLAGSILVFPSFTATVTFLFTLSCYAVAFLLAVLAVWFLRQEHKWRFLPAMVCMVGSLSIYQAYLAISASMLVLLLVQELLQDKKVLEVIRKGIMYVVFLAVSMILYYIATILVEKVVGYDGSLSKSNVDLLALPQNIAKAYDWFFRILFQGHEGLIPTAYSRLLHYLCLGTSGLLLLLWGAGREKKELGRFALLAVLILILPVSANCLLLLGGESTIHTLVLYGFIAIYMLAVIIADTCLSPATASRFREVYRRVCLNVVTIAIALIILFNTYLANEVYLNMHLRYENTHAFYTALMADIQMTPGFNEDTKLAVVGCYDWPTYFIRPIGEIMGASGFMPDDYSKDKFLEYYLGFEIPLATEAEISEIAASAEYADMAVYPYYGSIQMIGDTIVVKLS